jgi:hypothetical protein
VEGNGNAVCYWSETYNSTMDDENMIPNAFNNQRLTNFEEVRISGVPSIRYSENLDRSNGEQIFYVRCVDAQNNNIDLQEIRFNINVPEANRLRILNVEPDNATYGIADVELIARTSGGNNEGNSVSCSYSGNGLSGDLNSELENGNIYDHSTVLNGLNEGDYSLTVSCSDGLDTIVESSVFTVELDNVAPEIVQIVTQGSNKFVRTDEIAICTLSTTNDINTGTKLSNDEGVRHLVVSSVNYYLQCTDPWSNSGKIIKVNL